MTTSPSSPRSSAKSGGMPASPIREKLSPARVAELREFVEGTGLSFKRIGEQVGVSPATVSRYAAEGGWQRPANAAVPARIGNYKDRATEKLWKLTERHADALEGQPLELAQRSLQPLAQLTRVLSDIDAPAKRRASSRDDAPAPEPEPRQGRSLNELRDELAAHLQRIQEEEGYGWDEPSWWFMDGEGI